MVNSVREGVDTAVEVGATGVGLVAGLAAVSPEAGILMNVVGAAVGGIIGNATGKVVTGRYNA